MAELYIKYIGDTPVAYRYGEEWEAMRLLMEGGYKTPKEAIAAYERERGEDDGELKPCPFCEGKEALYQHTNTTKLYINTFGRARTLEIECIPCPPYANCSLKGIPARSAFIIKYCPECGRKLEG